MTENITTAQMQGVCRHCGSKKLRWIIENDEGICEDCSAVNVDYQTTDVLSISGAIESSSQVGGATLQHDPMGISSKYERQNEPINQIMKMKVRDSTEKNLVFAFSCLVTASKKLGISKEVLINSLSIYKKALENKLTRKSPIKSFCAGALYAASKICNCPKPLPEIASACNTNTRTAFSAYKILHRELKLNVPQPRLQDYYKQIFESLNLPPDITNLTKRILLSVEEAKFHLGKKPEGIVAAAIYIATLKGDFKITQRELAKKADVTELTIRTNCNGLRDILER